MFWINLKQKLADNTFLMKIKSPEVAKRARAGQFIMLRIDEAGERIPLTIADWDENTITIVFLVVGKTTQQLSELKEGDSIIDFVGPLGTPSEIKKFGNVFLIAGGLGIAPIYAQAKELHRTGNKVTVILGTKNKSQLFWIDELKAVSEKIVIATDDGSAGLKGFVTEALKKELEKEKPDVVITIGPPIMMKNIVALTKDIKTIASINTIMVDGIGMCGGCRVRVGDEIKFACVDGPEFDAHKVHWEEILNRNQRYVEQEKEAHHKCNIGLDK